jgi:hypothetical protein
VRNTWQIKGMENMTKDEYYKALMDRQQKIRLVRMEQEGRRHREPLADYYETLSRKRPDTQA